MDLRRTLPLRLAACVTVSLAVAAGSLHADDDPPQVTQAPPEPRGDLPEGWSRRGDTGVSTLDAAGRFAFGMQYRIVYDGSDLPGPGGTTPRDARSYDFFRQRLRLNLEASPTENAGAFVQVEFRGGWGGSAPSVSDPRGAEPQLNPFNFIQDRGLRYGYLFWKPSGSNLLMGGILPLSDEVGDTLFSADWDWNVGGLAWLGGSRGTRWRFAALSLVEGVGSRAADAIDRDGSLFVADFGRRARTDEGDWGLDWGAHAYALVVSEGLPLGGTRELWLGPTATLHRGGTALSLFGLVDVGELGTGRLNPDGTVASGFTDELARSHTGLAWRAELAQSLGRVALRGQLLHTSGDASNEIDRRFVTPMGLFGTQGYWAYTHIFTANGPSDTNDLGTTIDNAGAGLWTAQVKAGVPLRDDVGLELVGGWFRSAEPRRAGRDMGYELVASVGAAVSGPLRLDAGLAFADLGSFFGADAGSVYELFARVQLQY